MKKTIFISIIFFILISCNKEEGNSKIFEIESLRSEFIEEIEKPTTLKFIESIRNLNKNVIEFINDPKEETLTSLKLNWKNSAKIFSTIEFLNIGEIQKSLIISSFFTWNVNEENINQYIASANPITENRINSKPTNMRGLSAIEFLLFEKPPSETILDFSNVRRKEYLKVVSENLINKVEDFSSLWNNYRKLFIDNNESGINGGVNMLVNQMNVLLENVKRFKIGEPAGLEGTIVSDISKLQAEKSGISLELIKENIAIIKKTYFKTNNSLDDYVKFITNSNVINEKLKGNFTTVEKEIELLKNNTFNNSITTKVASIEKLYEAIKILIISIKVDVASALSITITFTDNDGD